MFLKPTTIEVQLYPGQLYVQLFLVFLMFISVPWMLFIKPFILKSQHKAKLRGSGRQLMDEDDDDVDEEEFEFGEVFVHQIIHTIEFVLGAVSNTASYLRLWALSLAHSELATVFWVKVLVLTMDYGWFMMFIGFAIWAACTFGVLLVMESLSAFLHALRLHWVEFQNKFYMGDGRRFFPFDYHRVLGFKEADL